MASTGQLHVLIGSAWVIVMASHDGLNGPGTVTGEQLAVAEAALAAL